MNYRPIGDIWWLARCKYRGGAKRYGGYPGGFLERARVMVGATITDPVLHVCAGLVRQYPYALAVGPNDRTLDLDPECKPDFTQDCLAPLPRGFRSVIADPPYTEADAEKYPPGNKRFPPARALLANMLAAVEPGFRVGILHYVPPRPPRDSRFVAAVTVLVGFDNRPRLFSVYERLGADAPLLAEVRV